MHITINTVSKLSEAAKQLLEFAGDEKIFLFFGDMGSGKTTFIKNICKQLQVIDSVSSPTYSIVNEYTTPANLSVYHFDLYRLKTETEALDLGFDEYLDSGSYCFIEWPDRVSSYWPTHYIKASLTVINETERTIVAEVVHT